MISCRTRFDEFRQTTPGKKRIAKEYNVLMATAQHFKDVGDTARHKAILFVVKRLNAYVQVVSIAPSEYRNRKVKG